MVEFDDNKIQDNAEVVNAIMQWRIYDVLLQILRNMNPEDANDLAKWHEEGLFASPPPAYRPGSE